MEEFYFCLAQIGLTAQPLCWLRKECGVCGTSLQGASETAEDSPRTFQYHMQYTGEKSLSRVLSFTWTRDKYLP